MTDEPERSHAADFAEHLIRSKGPMPANVIFAAFVNVGNEVTGADRAARLAGFTADLVADGRLELDDTGEVWRLADGA